MTTILTPLNYSQVVSGLRAIHSLEHGLRVYEDGEYSVRHFDLDIPFRKWMAHTKVALNEAHLVLDAYHQGLAARFTDPETGKIDENQVEHYQYLWHSMVGSSAGYLELPELYVTDKPFPSSPFVIRAYLLPLLGSYPTANAGPDITIAQSNLSALIDALHSLEGNVMGEGDKAGIALSPIADDDLWDFAHASRILQDAYASFLSGINKVHGEFRDKDFMLSPENMGKAIEAEKALAEQVVTISGLPPLPITEEILGHVNLSDEARSVLGPMIPSHV